MARSFFPRPAARNSNPEAAGPTRLVSQPPKSPLGVVSLLVIAVLLLGTGLIFFFNAWRERSDKAESLSREMAGLHGEVGRWQNTAQRHQRTAALRSEDAAATSRAAREDTERLERAEAALASRLAAAEDAQKLAQDQLADAQSRLFQAEQAVAAEHARSQKLFADAQKADADKAAREAKAAEDAAIYQIPWWEDNRLYTDDWRDRLTSIREDIGIRDTQVIYVVEQARQDVYAAEAHCQQLDQQIVTIRDQYQQVCHERDRVCRERDELKTHCEDLRQDVKQLGDQNTKLQVNVEKLTVQVQELAKALSAAQSQNSGGSAPATK